MLIPHLHSTPPLGGSHRNIAILFGMKKLEWLGYPTVKKIEDIFIRFHTTHERVRQTDGQTDEQTPHDGIALRGKKSADNNSLAVLEAPSRQGL